MTRLPFLGLKVAPLVMYLVYKLAYALYSDDYLGLEPG